MRIINLEQNTPEWLEFRKNHIGASDAPIIMGVSPWSTPYKLWQEKLGMVVDTFDNAAMKRGRDLERVARLEYFLQTGIAVMPAVIKDDWRCASLDGIDDTHQYIVEIKCPGKDDHQKALDGHIPDKYYPQLQHQLSISGLPSMHYFSFDGKEGVLVEVKADYDYQDKLFEKEKSFFTLLKTGKSPELTDRDYIKKDDDQWQTLATDFLYIQNQKKHLEEMEENIRKSLIQLSGGLNSLGGGIRVCQVARKGNIDYASIPEIKSIDLEQYRKPETKYWKIGSL